jgi:hypothetical protein
MEDVSRNSRREEGTSIVERYTEPNEAMAREAQMEEWFTASR